MAPEQITLRFRGSRGGRRDGAGRPPGRTSDRVPHVRRPTVSRHRPHYITVRTTRSTWNLRTQRCYQFIAEALAVVRDEHSAFRVVQFSVQHNHMHLIVEASDRRAMSGGLRALLIRVAKGLNRLMKTSGRRFDDRYHEHVLKTPTETRNALLYVVGNRAVHLARWGAAPRQEVDVFSSLAAGELVQPPKSWLLLEGWKGPPRASPPQRQARTRALH